MAQVYAFTDEHVAHLRGVRVELHAEADAIAARAKVDLRSHRDTGNAKITVTRGNQLDYFVNLDDPAALSIEYGREAYDTGDRHVGAMQGLYILHKAARL
jgi:hypothetical protein